MTKNHKETFSSLDRQNRYTLFKSPPKHLMGDDEGEFIRKGLLLKRGTHHLDRYFPRYLSIVKTSDYLFQCLISSFKTLLRFVCLSPSKIGYSLSTSPNALCNCLSMDDISGAVVEDPDGFDCHTECTFVIQVVNKDIVEGIFNDELKGIDDNHEIPEDSEMRLALYTD